MKAIPFFSKAALSVLLIGTALGAAAQHHEFGVGIGALNYAGDLSRGYDISAVRPGGQLYYRYNFNPITSVRGFAGGGVLSGSDSRPIDAFSQLRNSSFSLGLVEFGLDFEFNFINTKASKSLNHWSPYLFFGIGGLVLIGDTPVSGAGQYSSFQPMIPFGTGVKIDLSPQFTLSIEAGLRKLFTDWLDDTSGGNPAVKNYQYGNKYDKDWYNFVGISLSYTIYSINCPYYFYRSTPDK